MSIKPIENDLVDSEWTDILVNKAMIWNEFGKRNGIELTGDYGSYHCQFSGEIELKNGMIKIFGHRNFVDVPNVRLNPDVYIEVFNIEYRTANKIRTLNYDINLYRNRLIGRLRYLFSTRKRFDIDKNRFLGYQRNDDLHFIKSLELLELNDIQVLRVRPNLLKVRYGNLFTKERDIKQIEKIIDNIKTLHNSKYRKFTRCHG